MVRDLDINTLANQQNICFVLPTYNEEGTIESIIAQIKAEEKKQNIYKFSILVVDDNSIDQTQAIVKKVIDSTENIYLITGQKKGLGDAYKRGFLFALECHSNHLMNMMLCSWPIHLNWLYQV